MVKQISIDKQLYAEILNTKRRIEREGCGNPSYSNALRTMLDMPHIDGKGKFDSCNKQSSRKGTKIEQPKYNNDNEKKLKETDENIDIS